MNLEDHHELSFLWQILPCEEDASITVPFSPMMPT